MQKTVIFKAIEKCNSNCIYCDVIKKNISETMTFDLLKLIFQRMNDFLEKYQSATIDFTWHGGEVTLLGENFFKEAIKLQNQICGKTKDRINHLMQSNLLSINQKIIDVLREFGISGIGTSYEIVPNIRGIGKSRDSRRYNLKFLKGLDLLRKNNIECGGIYVVHKQSLDNPLEIFYHLANVFYDGSFKFNIVYVHDEDKYNLKITEQQYADFLGITFAEWWKNKYTLPQISPFREYVQAATENKFHSSCVNTGSCSLDWLYINPYGQTAHCSKGGDYEYPNYGNIKDHSLEYLFDHPIRESLMARNYILPQNECKNCRFWGVCYGGCPWASYNKSGTHNKKYGCVSKKVFLENYFEPISNLRFDKKPTNVYV